jgi:acetylornithine deacetylase/succinyl-diaminopimelate desuccinylase-like protein
MEEILAKLVAFKSVPDNYRANNAALEYIDRFVAERGLHTKRLEWNGAPALVATSRPRVKCPTLMLAGHIDVVPAANELFTLHTDDDKYFGRGVLDMKGSIAVFLSIINELKGQLDSFDFGLMITSDEELGGFNGTPKVLEAGYKPKVCILPDGGDNWQIQLTAKGVLQLRVATSGQAAHGSQPWNGDNANLRLIRILHDIMMLFPVNGPDTNTVNIGKISGGEAINQVPDAAEALIDIRCISEHDKQRLLEKVDQICHGHHAQMDVVMQGNGTTFEFSNPFIKRFSEIVTEVTSTEVTGSHAYGSSDARFFAALGIPCISLYPPGGGHHGPNEWVSIKGLQQLKTIVLQYLIETAQETPTEVIHTPDHVL